ncbi:MAG: hypothetical protein GY730_04950 [bacterium]|nr:hypothetical protein [bacterium]
MKASIKTVDTTVCRPKKIKKVGAIDNKNRHEFPVNSFLLEGRLDPDNWQSYSIKIKEQIGIFKEQQNYTDIHCYISGYTRLTLEIVKWCNYFGIGFGAYHYNPELEEKYSLQKILACRCYIKEKKSFGNISTRKVLGTMKRHEMPVDDYFLPVKAVDPDNIEQYELPIANKALEIKKQGYKAIDLYITGFYKITLMIIKYCRLNQLGLNAYHYDMEKELYLMQTVL